ncbi:MAG: flippase-like domain-containing protein [Bacteroidia bacterium]|nr:flippase-like domain-containing protein [Bacteroidia bacterium]
MIIAFVLLWFIYYQVKIHHAFYDFDLKFLQQSTFKFYLLLVFLLMLINWFIETVKWRYAIKSIICLSMKKSVAAILSGVAVSFFTPNRTGEFLGRLIFISKNKLPDALSATWVTNMAQLTITLLAGLTSVCFCIDYFFESKQIQGYIILIAFISFLIIAWAYFQLNVVLKKLGRSKLIAKKYQPHISVSSQQLLIIFLFSMLRYFCFCLQFLILLYALGCNFSLILLAGIAVQFLLLAIIPTMVIIELPLRATTATLVLSQMGCNESAIIQATFLLWLINLTLPAIAGICITWYYKRKH